MSFPFSSRTVGALITALAEGNSHSQLQTLFMSLGVESWDRQGERVNKERRVQGVLTGLRQQEDEPAARGALELARHAVTGGASSDGLWARPAPPWWQPLVDALAADGLEFDAERGLLLPSAGEVSITEEQSLLEQELEKRGWVDAARHYGQCAEGVAARNWESANSQGRSFLEDLIPRVASELANGAKAPGNPKGALQFLRDKQLLVEGEFDFAKGLWEMCNWRGSHPGQSSEEEARFRFMAVTAYARFMLSRLD